jgi:hypothetical protein
VHGGARRPFARRPLHGGLLPSRLFSGTAFRLIGVARKKNSEENSPTEETAGYRGAQAAEARRRGGAEGTGAFSVGGEASVDHRRRSLSIAVIQIYATDRTDTKKKGGYF